MQSTALNWIAKRIFFLFVVKSNYLLIALLSISALHADKITINNKSSRDLYIAIYYDDGKKAEIATPVQFLAAGASGSIERPDRKLKGISLSGIFYDRELLFADDKQAVKKSLTHSDLDFYHSLNLGTLKGDTFYIADKDGDLYGYNTVEWKVIQPVLQKARSLILGELPALKNNKYATTAASVRKGNALCPQEKAFLVNRRAKVKQAMEHLLGRSLDGAYIPNISLLCSGGGYRAMLYTTGCLRGASDSNVLSAVTYMVGLSGSTWAIGTWVNRGISIVQFQDWLTGHLSNGLSKVSADQAKLIANTTYAKFLSDQPLGIVDLYGALLANALLDSFGNQAQQMHLSDQAERVKRGDIPLPIYAAIAAGSTRAEEKWYEFTPFEIGAEWLEMYVPSWAWGRKFNNGKSIGFAPEQSFGFLMGTFGLAIGVTIQRLIKEAQLEQKVPSFAKPLVKKIIKEWGTNRPVVSEVHNFIAGMKAGGLATQKYMGLVDAGINFNLPYPLVSGDRPERKADIIIICDASSSGMDKELESMADYARHRGYHMPVINYAEAITHGVSIYKKINDPNAPVIIYIPRIVDPKLLAKFGKDSRFAAYTPSLANFNVEKCTQSGPCSTFNFNYNKKEALSMSMLGAFNMRAATDQIIEAIEWVIALRSPKAAKASKK